jgi:hypothetical protein
VRRQDFSSKSDWWWWYYILEDYFFKSDCGVVEGKGKLHDNNAAINLFKGGLGEIRIMATEYILCGGSKISKSVTVHVGICICMQ